MPDLEELMTTIYVIASTFEEVTPLCDECEECLNIDEGDDEWADTISIQEE